MRASALFSAATFVLLSSQHVTALDLSDVDPGPAAGKVLEQGKNAASRGIEVFSETVDDTGRIIQEVRMPDPNDNTQQITCRRICERQGEEIVCGEPSC